MFVDLDWLLNASSLLSASAELLVVIPLGLSLAVSKIYGFKVLRGDPPPRKCEIAYKAKSRRPIVHSRFWSPSLRFERQSSCVSCADQRYSLEILTLFVGKCLELRRTLRIRVVSSRRTFNVSFLRFLLGSDLRYGKTFRDERQVQKEDCVRVLLLDRMWRTVVEESWKRRCRLLSLSLSLGKPFMALNCYH